MVVGGEERGVGIGGRTVEGCYGFTLQHDGKKGEDISVL